MWNLDEAMNYYKCLGAPSDQSALIGLLREIQQECGGSIPVSLLKEAAAELEIKEGILLALVKRIPSLRLSNNHCLEICMGPNCGKHKHLVNCAEELKRAGKRFELKYVPCMRMCGKGPNVRWDGKVYHRSTEELIRKLVEDA